MTIFPISAFTDNYIWICVDALKKQAIVVDPGDAKPVLAFLQEAQLMLSAVLITHKHADHTGGVAELLSVFPDAAVFSHVTENVAETTRTVSDGDVINVCDYAFHVIAIPGHTLGHVAYYCKPYLFSGDTLFANGCGRIFEGTTEQMLLSLKKLMTLPDETQLYCGHEYTLANIQFALHVEANNVALQKRFEETKALRSHFKPTLPSSLKLEKATNPFLRCDSAEVVENVSAYTGKKLHGEVEVFRALREWKNKF